MTPALVHESSATVLSNEQPRKTAARKFGRGGGGGGGGGQYSLGNSVRLFGFGQPGNTVRGTKIAPDLVCLRYAETETNRNEPLMRKRDGNRKATI